MSVWHIQLLGALRARQGELTVERFATHKAGALLAYLALHPTRAHAREALTELFWPEADPDSGRLSLRVALSSLRRQLEASDAGGGVVLIADRTHVRLRPDAITTDVAQFEACLSAVDRAAEPDQVAALERAVAFYGGELLPGFYDDWVLRERQRLADACEGALRRLAEARQEAGVPDRALDAAHRALAVDPVSEEAHRDLMRLYAATGRTEAALRQYETLERLLGRDLGVEPDSVTYALREHLQTPGPLGARPAPDVSPLRETNPPVPTTPVLPPALTRFFGRESEAAQFRALLERPDTCLVTLTGPGGSGKTRLAVEVARRAAPAFAGGAYFVPLADLTEAAQIPAKLLSVLGLTATAPRDPLAQAAQALGNALLILDNMEHLVEDDAMVVQTLLGRADGLTCLVTSRQPLGLEGEQTYPVPPLPTPREDAPTPERLLQNPSAQLFADRARASRPDFAVTAHNAPAVAALCDRLEGIPLALELAAGWARTLTPAQMLTQLDRRFDFLVSRRRDASDRHRTLRAAIDWSYQRLPAHLQRFFARLSVFRGGCTVEAAREVCAAPDALECLTRLAECSLVVPYEDNGDMRYRLLETLREYASEQLPDRERRDACRRHRDHFLGLAEETRPKLDGAEQARWLDRLEAEHDNLRAALDWCGSEADGDGAELRLAVALSDFWQSRGYIVEACERLEGALARDANPTPVRARALGEAANHAFWAGDLERADALAGEGMALARRLGDAELQLLPLLMQARLAMDRGLVDLETARALQEELRCLADAVNEPVWTVTLAFMSGMLARKQGEHEMASAHFHRALSLARKHGHPTQVADALGHLALEALLQRHDPHAARDLLEESVRICREHRALFLMGLSLPLLGITYLDLGHIENARHCFVEAISLARRHHSIHALIQSLRGLAALAAEQGLFARAVRLYGAGDAVIADRGLTWPPPHPDRVARARAALGSDVYEAAYADGLAMTAEAAGRYALEQEAAGWLAGVHR